MGFSAVTYRITQQKDGGKLLPEHSRVSGNDVLHDEWRKVSDATNTS
jgi:hypothetical protein